MIPAPIQRQVNYTQAIQTGRKTNITFVLGNTFLFIVRIDLLMYKASISHTQDTHTEDSKANKAF